MKHYDDLSADTQSTIANLAEDMKKLANSRIAGADEPASNISLAEFIKEKYLVAPEKSEEDAEAFFQEIGIDPTKDTLHHFLSLPDGDGRRWLVPEILRQPIESGLQSSLWAETIATEENVRGSQITMAEIDMGQMYPEETAEGGSAPMGNLVFRDRKVTISKITQGIEVTDELRNQTPINLLATAMRAIGYSMNHKINASMMAVLLNGDQADGSMAAPTIGSINGTALQYQDILRAWIRMSMVDKVPDLMIGDDVIGEAVAMLPEFKDKKAGTPEKNLRIATPLPQDSTLYFHGLAPLQSLVILNKINGIIKFNFQNLLVETDRDITKGKNLGVASIYTGFANLMKDSRLVIKRNVAIGADSAANGYPVYFQAGTYHRRFA